MTAANQGEKACYICGRLFIPRLTNQATCGNRSCINKRSKARAKPFKGNKECQHCGGRIKGEGKRFCSTECRNEARLLETKKNKPPLFSHCQYCGKELLHKKKVKNGEYWCFQYYQKQKYCDQTCCGKHHSQLLVEKKRETNLKQFMDGNFVPKEDILHIEGNLLNIPDPFMCVED